MSAPNSRFPTMIITGANGLDWVATNTIEDEFHEYNLGSGATSGNEPDRTVIARDATRGGGSRRRNGGRRINRRRRWSDRGHRR